MYKVRSDDEALSVKWEGAFQDALGELSEAVTIFDVNYFTGRSIDDALEESTSGEVFLFVITCELRYWSSVLVYKLNASQSTAHLTFAGAT